MERLDKSVGIWIRVSTEDQARGESPEHHEKRARLYAEAKGWNVKEVYHLEALSGKTVMGYPQTQKMLEDIKSGHITGLIFSKLARLARNTRELLEFADIFNRYHADCLTPGINRYFYSRRQTLLHHDRRDGTMGTGRNCGTRSGIGSDTCEVGKTVGWTGSVRLSMDREEISSQ